MEEGQKQMTIWGAIALLIFGGGSAGGYTLFDTMLELGDERWVTVASQTQGLIYETEDELAEIQRRVDKEIETEDDRIRKAVLEERLKQLEKKQ